MTTKPSLMDLAADREARVGADDRRRAGFPEYDEAMREEIAAARRRVAQRRAVAADGTTLPALQKALATFAMHDGYQRDRKAGELRAHAAGSLQSAITLLTSHLDRDERLIDQVEAPSLGELKTWAPEAFQRAQRDRLNAMIQDARGLDHLLAVDVPAWEAEIRQRLTGAAIGPAPAPTWPAVPSRQARAASGTVDD